MKICTISLLLFVSFIAIPVNRQVQFFKKSQKKIDKKLDQVFAENKDKKDIVEYETIANEITFTTFEVMDDLTEGTLKGDEYYEESPTLVWRHIAMAYKNNTLEIYYDGQYIFH